MSGLLGAVNDQVALCGTDSGVTVEAAADLLGYVAQNYGSDEALIGKAADVNTKVNTVDQDLALLTTDVALPPKP